jgi:hypothetical protein
MRWSRRQEHFDRTMAAARPVRLAPTALAVDVVLDANRSPGRRCCGSKGGSASAAWSG